MAKENGFLGIFKVEPKLASSAHAHRDLKNRYYAYKAAEASLEGQLSSGSNDLVGQTSMALRVVRGELSLLKGRLDAGPVIKTRLRVGDHAIPWFSVKAAEQRSKAEQLSEGQALLRAQSEAFREMDAINTVYGDEVPSELAGIYNWDHSLTHGPQQGIELQPGVEQLL
jgi:hypothetical protein